jgi:signal transduction histidine kinase
MDTGRRRLLPWHWQFRPTVAKWSQHLTLRVRLALLVAMVVTVVVGLSTYLEMRSFQTSLERKLVETARSTADALATDLELQEDDTLADVEHGVVPILLDFRDAGQLTVRWISVVTLDRETGQPKVYATTATRERAEAIRLAKRVMDSKTDVMSDPRDLMQMVAWPIYHPADELFGVAVVTYSLESTEEIRKTGRSIVVWFVPPAIIGLTLLVDLLVRRMIHLPIAGIRKTMQRAGKGDLSARAPVVRRDEIGEVAEGLNQMLAQMENFNVALQARVREATEGLRRSNAELVESYQRVFGLREALARAEQMAAVGQTAASVAHQVGTPLNLISGYVQILREESGQDARIERRLGIVQEQIDKVATIVRTMLDHARRPVPRHPTSAAQMVERVCEVARPKLGALGVRLDLSVGPDVPMVDADAVALELALLNLITNSLDAMPEGGSLAVTVAATEAGVRIEVADTGTGIAPELLPRVFDPWVTTKGAGKGSGLGLSITRDVVIAHGGSIVAASGPGAGSRFTIDLPRATEPGAAAANVAEPPEGVWRTS